MDENSVDRDPLRQLRAWLDEARGASILEPWAMVLATSTREGAPSARVVLLRDIDATGLVFFTNYDGRKGQELAGNPRAAATFYWDPLKRQVRVEGRVERIGHDASAAYFAKRPRGSRISAWASNQSQVIAGRHVLEEEWARMEKEFEDKDVPLPPFWGGYRLEVETLELWQGRDMRLHDRLRYQKGEGRSWILERLAP
jgi:pyridoxamine 5'-phosphate oxidase